MNTNEMTDSPLSGLLGPCLRGAAFVALITGVAYPLLTTGVAQLTFPQQANGSLIEHNGTVVGSALIGQWFESAAYFHPRPSSTTAPDPRDASQTVPAPYNAALSAGSNLGPTNPVLLASVQERVATYRKINGLAADMPVPVDAVTASASGLDPHISPANAQLQVARVAQARGLTPETVQTLLTRHIEERWLGLPGEPRVNVLALNLALDAMNTQPHGDHHVQ